jgi:hypothetical protein
MFFLIGSAVAAMLVTLAAARYVVGHWPGASMGSQVFKAAASFPLLAILLFAIATAVTLFGASRANRPDLDPGMPIFALVFFLIYTLFIGVVVGVPTALVAVRMFRPG